MGASLGYQPLTVQQVFTIWGERSEMRNGEKVGGVESRRGWGEPTSDTTNMQRLWNGLDNFLKGVKDMSEDLSRHEWWVS